MKKATLIILIIVLAICSVTGLIGFTIAKNIKNGEYKTIPFLSLLNNATSTDLGVTYTEEEVSAFHQKIQSEAKALTSDSPECRTMNCVPGKPIFVGSQRVSVELTNSEGTGLINEWTQLSTSAPFTSGQMRVNSDGTVDFAGIVDMSQVEKFGINTNIPSDTMQMITKYVGALGGTFPLQASGKLEIKNNVVSANFSKVKVGVISVPESLLTDYAPQVNSFISDRLKSVPGLSIEELTFGNGKTNFTGTIPQKVYFVK